MFRFVIGFILRVLSLLMCMAFLEADNVRITKKRFWAIALTCVAWSAAGTFGSV